jgi:hypothetical protein
MKWDAHNLYPSNGGACSRDTCRKSGTLVGGEARSTDLGEGWWPFVLLP